MSYSHRWDISVFHCSSMCDRLHIILCLWRPKLSMKPLFLLAESWWTSPYSTITTWWKLPPQILLKKYITPANRSLLIYSSRLILVHFWKSPVLQFQTSGRLAVPKDVFSLCQHTVIPSYKSISIDVIWWTLANCTNWPMQSISWTELRRQIWHGYNYNDGTNFVIVSSFVQEKAISVSASFSVFNVVLATTSSCHEKYSLLNLLSIWVVAF